MYGKCLVHKKCLINSHCGCGDDHDKGEEGERKWPGPVVGSFQNGSQRCTPPSIQRLSPPHECGLGLVTCF